MQKDYESVIQPKLCDAATCTKICGRYFISNVENIRNSDFKANVLLTLSDATCDYSVYVNYCPNSRHDYIPGELVFLRASVRCNEGTKYHLVDSLIRNEPMEYVGSDLSILPKALCPVKDAFDCFMVMVSRIEDSKLFTLIENVLLQPDVAIRFLNAPATQEGHHNYAGGLLKHSVEIAWNVYGVQKLNQLERDFAVAAALLHGIGRLRPAQLIYNDQSAMVQELNENLKSTCSDALASLRRSSPSYANEMWHLLTCFHEDLETRVFSRPSRVEKYLKRAKTLSKQSNAPEFSFPKFEDLFKGAHATP